MKKLLWTLFVLLPFACCAQIANSPPPDTNQGQGYAGALEQVRDRLGLTASQQAIWHAYEMSIDAYNGLHYREMPVVSTQGDKAPRQIGRLVDNLQNRLAALEDIEKASKELYAGLTPAQQLSADQWLLSTVPTFISSAGYMNAPQNGSSRQNGRSDGGMRSRRGGSSGGGSGGGF